ncbi:MAG TPA: S53 family peptidase [Xanthobacteraceae bacterium]|nr:S53 family peptidase [Xanthobacteraceae bacterium]
MRAAARARPVELVGSHRAEPENARVIGEVAADEPIVVWLYLKSPDAVEHAPGSAADLAALAPTTTRRGLARRRAAEFAPAVAAVRKFAEQNGLTVRNVAAGRRTVVLKGPAARMCKAFGASLCRYDDGRHQFRARAGALKIPRRLAPWVRAVLGFDHRPQVPLRPAAGDGAGSGLWPSEVAALYGIPLGSAATTQCVGIIALGGGFLPGDVQKAADQAGRPRPVVIEKSVNGATNQFGGGTHNDEEIALDMQVIAGIVPAVRIVVYFASNTTASLAAAIHQAVHDDDNRPQVLSISWGSAEKFWQQGPRDAVQAALADAITLKVSVVAASGDLLATGGVSDGAAHVFYPSSSPYVLGCGGTIIAAEGDRIASEIVWKENFTGTGGGISEIFPVPDFQTHLPLPPSVTTGAKGRGVPDVAAAAASMPGYRIILDGDPIVKDGTSAVAPLWAAMIALANARRAAPVGHVNPILYGQPELFRPITQGDNRVGAIGYAAAPGLVWNACTGLGAPRGAEIIAALIAAGAPVA